MIRGLEGYCGVDANKTTSQCTEFEKYTKICTNRDSAAMRRAKPGVTIPDDCSTNGGFGNACTTFITQNFSFCSTKDTELRSSLMTEIAEEYRNTEGLSTDQTLTVGENRSSVCAAYDNSGSNAIFKALQDVSSQVGTSLVNGASTGTTR
jgi:hypothetical protein